MTWTNIRILLSIKDENKRNYYINLCIRETISHRNLKELIKSNSYERLSYKDKNNIEIISNEENLTIKDMIKNPIHIEVDKDIDKINEKVLQELLIEKLEKTLLELGHGFMYGGKEVNLGGSFCDMLFFNTKLNAYVFFELKVRKLKKQDIGQVKYYMNYIDENMKKDNFNKTIGIIITREEDKFVLSYCSNQNVYNTTYKLVNKEKNKSVKLV